jgi:hypothetical protein
MKSQKKIKHFIFTMLITSYWYGATAQMTGWPTNSTNFVVADGEIVKFDDTRTGITLVSSNSPNYDLSIKPGSTTGVFNIGDFCLLISMEDGLFAGFHKSCTVVNTFGSTIRVSPNNSSGWGSFAGLNKLQLLKVRVYDSITLNHGQITCNPYDESTYTGGVLAFVCDEFILNAGYVNASGQGISPYTIDYGIPGVGGNGSNTYLGNNGGKQSINTPPCYTPDPLIGKNIIFTSSGTSGDAGLNNGGSGTGYSYTPTINNSTTNNNYPFKINMGTPGILGNSTNSATGGAGGGHGGNGRNLDNTFIDGDDGQSGDNGDDLLQKNSRGGGIVIAKIGTLIGDNAIITSATSRFICNGSYGSNGGHGGLGGNGGAGGIGENGYCNGDTVFFSGAMGGYGEPGEPGNGGDGTNGGRSGSIWYLSNQNSPVIGIDNGTPINYATPSANLFEVEGGKGGKGGVAGISQNFNYATTLKFDTTNCNPLEWCIDSSITAFCDCDTVFASLQGKNDLKYDTTITPNYVTFGKLGSNPTSFDTSWGVLKYKKSQTVHYYCPMSNPKQFDDILKLIGTARLSPYQNNSSANIEAVALPNGNVRFQVQGTKWPIAEYDFATNTLTDLDDPERKSVVETNCLYSLAAFGGAQSMKVGNAGNDGNDYQYPGDKSLDPSNVQTNANVVFFSPAPTVEEELNNHLLSNSSFNIYPNPNVKSEILISSEEVITSIQIIDINGKTVLKQTANNKKLNMNIDSLPDAHYTIICKTQNKVFTRKFIKLNY